MAKPRTLILLVVAAHWFVAVWHLFLAANVLPVPGNNVSWLAITLITSVHLGVFIALWKLSEKLTGLVSLIFFLTALGLDLYEHFLHPGPNNLFMVTPGDWTALFGASVYALVVLEILGCWPGTRLLRSRAGARQSPSRLNSRLTKQDDRHLSSDQFTPLTNELKFTMRAKQAKI